MADERHSNAKTQAGGDLPVWLRGVPLPARPSQPTTPPEAPPVAPPSMGELPDWLRGLQDPEPAADAESVPFEPPTGSEQLPNWLASLAAEATNEPTTPAAKQAPARVASDEGMPDWLRELSSGTDEPFAESPESQSNEPPAWLRASENTPVEPPSAPEPPPVNPSSRTPLRMPIGATNWLQSLGEESEPIETPAPTTRETPAPTNRELPQISSDDEGIPAWLRDIPSDEIARDLADIDDAPSGQAQNVEPSPGRAADFEMPSWLAPDDSAAQERPGADDAPAWLRGATAPPASDNDDVNRASAAGWLDAGEWPTNADAADEPPPAERPAWLQDSAESSSTGDHLRADEARDVSPTSAWLQEARDDRSASSPGRTDEPIGTTSEPLLPDWLADRDVREPPRSSSPAANDDLPAWLQMDDTQPAAPETLSEPEWSREPFDAHEQPSSPSSSEGDADADLPDWLRMDMPSTPAGPSAPALGKRDDPIDVSSRSDIVAPTNAALGGDELPSWLRADTHDVADPVEQTPPTLAPGERTVTPLPAGDELDWLHTLRETPSSPAAPANQSDDLPDWMRPDVADVPPPRVPSPPPHDDTLPDWLHDDPSTSGRNGGLPSWLQGADQDVPQRPTSSPERSADVPTTNGSNLPPWLRDEAQAAAAETAETQRGSDFLGLGGADLPSWLRGADAPPSVEPVGAATATGETYTDWLARLRTQQDEDVESEGALAEPTDAFSTLKRPTYVVKPERVEAIALLQRLVAEPFPVRSVPATEAVPVRQSQGLERILYLLLLVAMIVGLIVPQLTRSLQGSIVAPDADRLTQTINGLGENDIVLVAYEWDARRRGELAPLEQAVINHLAQRKVKFVFISTDLQGTFLSYDARDRLLNQFGYRPRGLDYILLGYKPGGELALRQVAQNLPAVLASDFSGADANGSAVALDVATGNPRLTSVNDFAAVVVMADDPQDVQGWMEQVRPQMATAKPFILLMPTETMPVVQPYLRMPGVLALAGRQGALAYEQRQTSTVAANATAVSGQIPFAVASFIVLVLFGALVGGLFGALQRPRTP